MGQQIPAEVVTQLEQFRKQIFTHAGKQPNIISMVEIHNRIVYAGEFTATINGEIEIDVQYYSGQYIVWWRESCDEEPAAEPAYVDEHEHWQVTWAINRILVGQVIEPARRKRNARKREQQAREMGI